MIIAAATGSLGEASTTGPRHRARFARAKELEGLGHQ
jgi:hypothetical protein